MTPASLLEPNHRILIVDDNQAIHDDIRKILIGRAEESSELLSDESLLFDSRPRAELVKFEIDSSYQGQEGLDRVRRKLAENKPYAMAFVDVRMPPGWDGVETITRLWQVDPALQIVICTAYSDYSWDDIQAKLGHSENLLILKKPFDHIEVIQLAHALTRKWLATNQAQARLEDLDLMVARRTAELQAVNEFLQKEFGERAKAEEAFRLVFEASPIGIALLDDNFRFVSANTAIQQLHGLPKESIIGNDPLELEWFNTRDELKAVLGAGPLQGGVDEREFTLKHAKFGIRTGLLWARYLDIHDVRHLLCFVLDISERKEIEEKLRRARLDAEDAAKAKSQFVANMSHEIRTPLNGVLGISSFLEEESLPSQIRDMGKLIRTSGEMLRRVLDDVLDFSKIEAGKLEFENEIFVVRDSLEWSVGIFRKTALEKQLALILTVEDDVPNQLVGDVTRIRQVLTNLISNAVKFTEKGSIEVSVKWDSTDCRGDSGWLQLSVADTGVGIPGDRIGRLFQSFSQIDASTNRRFGGTGLGLAISKQLVEMMGGQITVHSTRAIGTRFVFTLPLSKAEIETHFVSPLSQSTAPKRILVAEDNQINRIVIQRMLEKLGHVVDIVSDGDMAVRQVELAKYDLFFTDLHMPGIDGFEVARRIRALPSGNASLPVIALTASATVEDRQACLAAGMNYHLSKPIDIEALRAIIARWSNDQPEVGPDSSAAQPALVVEAEEICVSS